MERSNRTIDSSQKTAFSRLTGDDLADYILGRARGSNIASLPPNCGLSATQTHITTFACTAHLSVAKNIAPGLHTIYKGTLSIVFSSLAGGLVTTQQGHYWDPASLTVTLNLEDENGTASAYKIKLFKGASFEHMLDENGCLSRTIGFNPVRFGEPVTLFIETKSIDTAKELYDHMKQTLNVCFP